MKLRSLMFLMLSGFLFQACQPYSLNKEISQTESLIKKVENTKTSFVIDLDEIARRRDTMNVQLRYIQNNFADTVSMELQLMLTDYRGLIRNYNHFLREYPVVEIENQEHLERLKNLQADLLAKRFTPAEFEAIYAEEVEVINKHSEAVKECLQRVVLVDPLFRRTSTQVETIYNQLRLVSKK